MTLSLRQRLVFSAIAGVATAACSTGGEAAGDSPASGPVDAGVPPPSDGGNFIDITPRFDLGAECDPARSIRSNGAALLIQDAEILSRLSLERVLKQLLLTSGASSMSPQELLQRLFDTTNTSEAGVFTDNMHCDGDGNQAFSNAPPVDCPRAEAVLATRNGSLIAGDPDSFEPVAIVNRFDLIPETLQTCGEYRIVYGKRSGRSDPQNRLLLIFEGALSNSTRSLAGCRAVAELWAGFDSDVAPADRVAEIDRFFFAGLPGFEPLIHAKHFGIEGFNCGYFDCGQVRVALGMQSPWEFREFRLRQAPFGALGPPCAFVPVTVKNTPVPDLFDPLSTNARAADFQWQFVNAARDLALAKTVGGLQLAFVDAFNAGQSALEGSARPDYLSRARGEGDSPFLARIAEVLGPLDLACPEADPITAESVVQRATALTCAGCHAPEQILSPTRELGCGLVWPKTSGAAHIDENGTLSEALVDVLLPHRANVLATYLQACDRDAIVANLQPSPPVQACFVAGTPIAMADGTQKAIEHVVAGDMVMAFDERRSQLMPGEVVRRFVHPTSDSLVVINSKLVATANHPFYSAGNWVRADALNVGAPLLALHELDSVNGSRLEVALDGVFQLAMREGTTTTYNFEVAVHHNYFAGGILVHNKLPR